MAKILTFDLETQRAVVERFDLYPSYTPIDRVIVPARILCYAAKWYDEDEVIFHAAWDDDDKESFDSMVQSAWDLMNEADVVIGWNSTRFDVQWFQAAFGRLGLGPPSPFKSLDLMQVAKKNFKAGEMSLKLQWFSQKWLGDEKIPHEGIDLWHQIRYGDKKQKAEAEKLMRTYNEHDVILTENIFDRFRPWIGVNFALFDEDNIDREVCPKCESPKIQKRGLFFTTTYAYQRYYCNDCKGWSRGKRMIYTTELRPA